MCLIVNYNRVIDDAREYTFYKVYEYDMVWDSKKNDFRRKGTHLISPYYPSRVRPGQLLVAKALNSRLLPELGQDAYDRYARETCLDNKLRGSIEEGLHAFEFKNRAFTFDGSFDRSEVYEVKVKGEHIIAFGNCGDVAFTRGVLADKPLKARW